MKKFVSAILILSMLLCVCGAMALDASAASYETSVWDGTAGAGFASGTGTQDDPYIISEAKELDYLATSCMAGESYENKYIKLTVNVNWNGMEWTQIGYSTSKVFKGNFDGNGKTIYNLNCSDKTVGIFSYVTNGTIKNLNVDYATFTSGDRYGGAIVGLIRGGKISGCSAGEHVEIRSAEIMSNTAQMGGIAGWTSGVIENCTFNGKVNVTYIKGSSFVGGIVGCIANGGDVKYCINNGIISAPNPGIEETVFSHVGGIAGGNGASGGPGTLEFCINKGTVSGVGYVGGICGRVHVEASKINNSYNVGTIEARDGFGGACLGLAAKGYVADNVVGSGAANVTVGCGASGSAVVVNDDDFKVSDANVIKLIKEYSDIEDAVALALSKFDSVDPEADPKPETTPAPETTPEPETTPAPETTPEPETTPAPADDKTTPADVTTTERPSVTTKPKDDEGKGGCGSFSLAGIALLAVVGSAVIVIKKH